MTIGEKLLNLAADYNNALLGEATFGTGGGGRTPAEIAAEYEATLRELLAPIAAE